jgi:solute carrier family 66 (lysosomal lysine-arginine transporter), member 1
MSPGSTLSLVFTILNVSLWTGIMIPQVHQNYKLKSSSAISYLLVFFWFVGSILSITSAHLKKSSKSIVYIGVHHLIMNMIIMSQLLYYRILRKSYITYNEGVVTCVTVVFLFILFLVSSFTYDINDKLLPEIIAWLSLLVYTVSRIPQIYLNWRRRSVHGLSYISFICITMTNFCFAGSIFAHLLDKSLSHIISKNLQWIIGIVVTLIGDAVIMYQFYKYRRSRSVLGYMELHVSNDGDSE